MDHPTYKMDHPTYKMGPLLVINGGITTPINGLIKKWLSLGLFHSPLTIARVRGPLPKKKKPVFGPTFYGKLPRVVVFPWRYGKICRFIICDSLASWGVWVNLHLADLAIVENEGWAIGIPRFLPSVSHRFVRSPAKIAWFGIPKRGTCQK